MGAKGRQGTPSGQEASAEGIRAVPSAVGQARQREVRVPTAEAFYIAKQSLDKRVVQREDIGPAERDEIERLLENVNQRCNRSTTLGRATQNRDKLQRPQESTRRSHPSAGYLDMREPSIVEPGQDVGTPKSSGS